VLSHCLGPCRVTPLDHRPAFGSPSARDRERTNSAATALTATRIRLAVEQDATPNALAVRCLAKHFGADEAAALRLAAEQVAATTTAVTNEEGELSQRANAALSSNVLLGFSTCSKIGWAPRCWRSWVQPCR
jgi:hypothetical protein